MLIDRYLKPYFESDAKNFVIQARARLIIRGVEFKVFGCYPPKGFVNDATKFHLCDNDGRLRSLRWRPIRQIHLLPTQASHATYQKVHDITPDPEPADDSTTAHNNEALLRTHLKPYLKQTDEAFYIKPRNGRRSIFEEEQKQGDDYVVVPTASTKMRHRHLMEEETFVSKGIEWRVMRCQPPDGYIDASSIIYCHGPPLTDCEKISVRPIFESLPNAHKNYTPRQIQREYLEPFFRGTSRFIDHSREIKIAGVDFSIRESVPSAALITCATLMDFNAAPVHSQELAEMQAQEDMELARQLQEEENSRSPFPSMSVSMGARSGRVAANGGQFHQVTLADITEIFERLQQSQAQAQGAQGAQGVNPNNDPFLQFIRQLQVASQHSPRRPRNNGVNPQLIDRLPTIRYRASTQSSPRCPPASDSQADGDDGAADIDKSCRICLEYYEDGEELRFLPCFHKYHKDCVDRWFQMSSKCPVCKTSIIQSVGARGGQ